MIFSKFSQGAANKARKLIQKNTINVSEGEAAAISVWWTFINDHARYEGHDPKELARRQLEAFLKEMPIELVRTH